jgi:hypothetical protein
MVRDIPYVVFCYKFYLIIKKIRPNLLLVKVNTYAGIAKLYEYLALNAIAIFKFVSK